MSVWISAASVLGALGLFVVGQRWIVAGSRALYPKATRRLGAGAGRGLSFSVGALSSLVTPSNAWSTRAVLASVHRHGHGLERGLWQLLGASLALAWTGWLVVAVRTGNAVFEPLGWGLLGLGGLLAVAVPRMRTTFWIVLGAGLCILALIAMDDAFGGLAGKRLDAFGLAMPVRCLAAVLIAAGLAAAIRSPGAVVAAMLFAAEHGSLHLTTGLSVFMGASIGSLIATVPAWTPFGTADGRRAAIGASAIVTVGVLVTVFIVVLGLPMLGDLPAPFDRPLWSLTGWMSVALIAAALITIPFAVPGTRLLESRLGVLGSDTKRSDVLDPAALALPPQAFESLHLEIEAMRGIAVSLARRVLGEERVSDFRITRDIEAVEQRAIAVSRFTDELLSQEVVGTDLRACERMPSLASVYVHVSRQMNTLRHPDLSPARIPDAPLRARILQFRWGFLHYLEQGCVAATDPLAREQELQQLEVHRRDLERRILTGCWQHTLDPNLAHGSLDAVEILRGCAEALFFALGDAHVQTEVALPEPAPVEEPAAGATAEPETEAVQHAAPEAVPAQQPGTSPLPRPILETPRTPQG